MLCGTDLCCHTKALQFRVWSGRSSPHSDHRLFSTCLNTFIATREEEGPFVMTNGCRTASVTSSPRRTKRPSTYTVGKVGWSVERETWCRLTLERQPSAGLRAHQSRSSIREIMSFSNTRFIVARRRTQTALKGGENLARARISWEDAPPRPTAQARGGQGG